MAESLRRLWAEVRELGLGSSGELDRLDSAPSPLQFLRDYVSANRPCIISRSATSHWPAIARSLWVDDDYLCDTLRFQTVSVHLTPNGRADSVVPLLKSGSEPEEELLCFATPCVQQIRFPEALRLISSPSSIASVAYAQQQNDCFRGEYSALAPDVEPHFPWATEAFGCLPEAVNLWIGNSLSQTSFHKDHYENLYVVITGEKHFLLLPPTDLHRLYIRPYPAARYIASPEKGELILELESPERQVPWCSVDPFSSSPEAMARQMTSFPLYFDGPKPFECTLKAGEILYLPSMWFHHVRQTPDCNGRTIAINYWYDMQFDIKYAYFNFLKSFNCRPQHLQYAMFDRDCEQAMDKSRDGEASVIWERDVIFCDLCVKEVESGNRPTTFFNKEGWQNILKNFAERTGKEYNKTQLKNKWDQLKKDWKLWKELKGGTSELVWDPKKKTIDASDDWWKMKLEVVPNARKFRYCGIDPKLEEKLDLMFGDIVATCEHVWTPSQELLEDFDESDSSDQSGSSNNLIDESINSVDDHTQSSHYKHTSSLGPRRSKKKKCGAIFLRNQISQLVTACINMTSGSSSLYAPPSLSEAIKVLDQMVEVFEDSPLYLHSTVLLEDMKKRNFYGYDA